MTQIAIISATSGNNLKLAKELQKVVTNAGAKPVLVNLEEYPMPVYTPPQEKSGVPEKAAELTEILSNSQGMIFCAPEYNGSIPPIVNNAIAWVSRTGSDWRGAFNDKVAVVGTHSGGGGLKVCQAMRQQLEHVGCTVLARPIITNNQKELNPESADTIVGLLIRLAGK
ncbi:MAG: NADPH-dependent oxidoreductase [Deltaproteobacteria bacterium]|nr:MAG: NADPH-dependent oxidoreductase [Deltaproteobacteria bacterium]TNF24424.1 MAG: NADPH-dependent oxidoreductase [Deltaproteobacteria bacterium]